MFAMFGDMGNDNAVSLPYLQREVGEGVYDAIIHVGDMAYDMAELDGLRGDIFMEQIEPISSMIPYMTCPGLKEIVKLSLSLNLLIFLYLWEIEIELTL